jgi:hypothetical protein
MRYPVTKSDGKDYTKLHLHYNKKPFNLLDYERGHFKTPNPNPTGKPFRNPVSKEFVREKLSRL